MRKLVIITALAAIAAAPRPSPDAQLRAIAAQVNQAQLRQDVETLVSFGTRHTLSSQTDPKRGIGAALSWGQAQFEADGLPAQRICDTFSGDRLPGPTRICDMVAIQRGTLRPNDVVIITGHIDSRVSDPMNANAFEPGANDDGSGSAAVLEAARVLSKHKFPGTIVYSLDSGEEQGLYGGHVIAAYAKAQGWNVIADLNNDIIGNSCSSDGVCDAAHVRVFSEGPRWQGHEELAGAERAFGGENDAPSRNISRYLDSLADRLKIGLDVRQIWRNDRFGRGGDHSEFLDLGFPAVRMTVAVENYDWQHQDVRVEKGVHYGDTPDHMDFSYLTRIVKLNVAALASMASAPPPPEPMVEGAVSTDMTVSWLTHVGEASHIIRWRRTDSNQWEHGCVVERPPLRLRGEHAMDFDWRVVLPHVRVDDWVFGVSSVSPEGFESPVASAVPGGDFKPWSKHPPRVPEPSQMTAHCLRIF